MEFWCHRQENLQYIDSPIDIYIDNYIDNYEKYQIIQNVFILR